MEKINLKDYTPHVDHEVKRLRFFEVDQDGVQHELFIDDPIIHEESKTSEFVLEENTEREYYEDNETKEKVKKKSFLYRIFEKKK